jgi:hypothetical protein
MGVTSNKATTKKKKKTRRAVCTTSSTVRRSFALPRQVVTEATAAAPAELQGNLNRLVTTALQEYTESRKRLAFEEAMAAMAADPAISRASTELMAAFRTTESDGLPND